jgi:ABC-type sugar transport system ATPase subunit
MQEFAMEMHNISKAFPGVQALGNVDLKVKKGTIHALVGENGAGKSTLMKVLSGVYPYGTYDGDILLNGKIQRFHMIDDSIKAGMATIYQELALVKYLDIVENMFLGHELKKCGIIDYSLEYVKAKEVLAGIGLNLEPSTKVMQLGVGQQQLVEIAKSIVKNADVIILDEPTSALTEEESQNLLNILRGFREKGITCIYISHKLNEVLSVADTISVLRDGQMIGTYKNTELNEDKLISLMVGRSISQRFPYVTHAPGEIILELKDWTVYDPDLPNRKKIDNLSFTLRKGEILGIAGLMGSGRTEMAMSMIGSYGVAITGDLFLHGKKIVNRMPKDAIDNHLCYLTEDRKGNGLVLGMDVKKNISLPNLQKIRNLFAINENEEIRSTEKYVNDLQIKTPSISHMVKNLSGGNQQKVVLGKWLMASPDVLILDEPTRGIDVGAKYEIYLIMNKLVESGVGIIMISSELPEILGMSDRIIVINEGRLTGEFTHSEATQEKIMLSAIRRKV